MRLGIILASILFFSNTIHASESLDSTNYQDLKPLRTAQEIMQPERFFGVKPETRYFENVGIITGYDVYMQVEVKAYRFGLKYKYKELIKGGFVELDVKLRGKLKKGKLIVLNGYIEQGSILTDEATFDGNCKFLNKSIARDRAKILGNARVEKSFLFDDSVISDKAFVSETSVFGSAKIKDNARVKNSEVSDNAIIEGWAIVSDQSDISGNSVVGNFTKIDNADEVHDEVLNDYDDSDDESQIDLDKRTVAKAKKDFEQVLKILGSSNSEAF